MPPRNHPQRSIRLLRAGVLVVATLVVAILAAGCGGSAPSQTTVGSAATGGAATGGSAATRSSTTGSTSFGTGGAIASRSTAAGSYGSGPLGFAKCMRANGLPNFPDPKPGGQHEIPAPNNPAAPAFDAAQRKCEKLIPGSGPPGSGPPPSAKTLARLRRIAECMRGHGVPQFPDPRTSVPSNLKSPNGGGDIREITDYDGAILLFPTSMDLQAPAYRHALTVCGAPPLGLPH
jgi:hypothetical protein